MPQLRVRQLAEARGLDVYALQQQSGVAMPSTNRYWHGTADGDAEGVPLRLVDLEELNAIAKVMGVKIANLIEDGASAL